MSEISHREFSSLPEFEKINGSSNNGNFIKPQIEHKDENSDGSPKKSMMSIGGTPTKIEGTENSEVDVASSEVEYIESEHLNDVDDVEICLKTVLSGLSSKDWVSVCDALNNVRRLSIFHKEVIRNILDDAVSLMVKSLKNPRSAVCKTAIMACADIFKAYADDIIDLLDPLLVQLLLKSSQDKRFVCEAAERALIALTTSVSPLLLLPKLQPYIKNRNPRIRAKASMCFCRSVPQLGIEETEAFGMDKLIQTAASQLTDQLPESRDAARTLLLELQSMYEKSHLLKQTAVSEDHEIASWEHFCQSKLSPLSAHAVLRVTTVSQEGLVLGS